MGPPPPTLLLMLRPLVYKCVRPAVPSFVCQPGHASMLNDIISAVFAHALIECDHSRAFRARLVCIINAHIESDITQHTAQQKTLSIKWASSNEIQKTCPRMYPRYKCVY